MVAVAWRHSDPAKQVIRGGACVAVHHHEGHRMSKVNDALDALRAAQDLLDDLEEWAAAGHVSMATSLLYGASDVDRRVQETSPAPVSPGSHGQSVAPRDSEVAIAQNSLSAAE